MTPRRALVALLASGLVLLIVGGALLATARLLAALGDDAGAMIVDRISLVAAALAGLNLAALVAVNSYLLLSLWEEPADGTDHESS